MNFKELEKKLISYRRYFHENPELSYEEENTAKKIQDVLKSLEIPFKAKVAGNGIIAELKGKNEKPFIALRADMDALPIEEATGLSFASKNKGIMHACAHDGHMSILLGAAEILKEKELSYPVRLIFQPAEEVASGAKEMISAGALDSVAMIFGGHIDRHYEPGKIIINPGAMNASSDSFTIEIGGQGGHGARPHETTDAVVIGSLLVMALQTLVSREINPAHPSVVSVGKFEAGTAGNVIAGSATLKGTIRAQDNAVREHLREGLKRVARSVAELHQASVKVVIDEGTPAVLNTDDMASLSKEAASNIVGVKNVISLETANMGGEDFGYYLEKIPGSYVRYGAKTAGKKNYPAHSDKFDFDESALMVGAKYLSEIALLSMEKL